ncbi:DUF7146 domain-containing protein [Lichenihabitans psoromatis]|uniref:DUF7146 domain-containing protein n=1 Tax=Lichenihabitans psoromatis TaxID=2528642 RepID=UPI0010385A64|nr:CHC2 zinc finger domain-containing protein [Lichenihabitans psoromatis]
MGEASRRSSQTDRAFDAWIDDARAIKVVEELSRRGHFGRMKRAGAELAGPCPLCGGTDRFSVHPAKNIWNCRKCDAGGDAIALVRNVDGLDFLRAVELLTGVAPPGHHAAETPADRAAREARQAAYAAQAAREDERREAEALDYRDRERARMFKVWREARPIAGTIVERYLALRRVQAPAEARLRFLPNYALWSGPQPSGTIVHRGPAMMAAIVGPDGKFGGLHTTWIDLTDPDGKARVPDPKTGEFIPAKKVRGSKRGGSILLAQPGGPDATVLFLGEGIETVLSVLMALIAAQSDVLGLAEFRSSVDLGNLSGKAAGKVAHPHDTTTDKNGRIRHVLVGNAVPDLKDRDAVIAIGATIETIVLIGDGDSDPFTTRLALERAAARFNAAYPWVEVRLIMAPPGSDFNDVWRATPDADETNHQASEEAVTA